MNHPITVFLFNRPDETRRTLESLLNQTCPIPHHLLTFSVDGYPGSRDESVGRPDHTGDVAGIAAELFPRATVVSHDHNLGIAGHFHEAESRAFNDPSNEWALFFEDDYVLAPNYMENLEHVVASVDHDERIAVVSVTGDSWGIHQRGIDSLYPMNHAWAFALRRSHHVERHALMETYLASMDGCRYFERDYDRVTRAMASAGVLTLGTSQDYVKQAIRIAMGRVAVTTGRAYGEYIGANGEHFTPEIFADLGYGAQSEPATVKTTLSAVTDELVENLLSEQRTAVALESLSLAGGRVADAISTARAELAFRERAHEAEVDALCHRIASVESDLRDAEDRLTAVYRSTSWRVTKPLRTVRRVVPH